MERHLLLLPDGRELFSGAGQDCAITSVKLTQCVNPDQELTPGGVCAGMLEVKLYDGIGAALPEAGQEAILFSVDDAGVRRQLGIFRLEKPARTGAHGYTLTAYDRASLLDKDLSQWLYHLTGWPFRLQDFAQLVCAACGVELAEEDLPNGDFPVQAFSGSGITGRQLMKWVGQAAGRFCRANENGVLEWGWFTPRDIAIGPTGDAFYYQGSLTASDFITAPVEKVQLRLTAKDVGAVYPDLPETANTMAITGNHLLASGDAAVLEQAAQTLYGIMQPVAYTPMKLSVPASVGARAGDILTVTDARGKVMTLYVMTCVRAGQKLTLSATGSVRRDSSTAMNNTSYRALSGKVLELNMDVEGLRVENRDAQENLAALELTVEGISATVAQNQQDVQGLHQSVTTLQQTADGVTLTVQKIESDGVSRVVTKEKKYTLDDEGLCISGGEGMENLLDETGMTVSRGGQVLLRASDAGVTAVDVQVRNYLVMGEHARFEDYSDGLDSRRTACFWMEGA